jgi:hypothetical protein
MVLTLAVAHKPSAAMEKPPPRLLRGAASADEPSAAVHVVSRPVAAITMMAQGAVAFATYSRRTDWGNRPAGDGRIWRRVFRRIA